METRPEANPLSQRRLSSRSPQAVTIRWSKKDDNHLLPDRLQEGARRRTRGRATGIGPMKKDLALSPTNPRDADVAYGPHGDLHSQRTLVPEAREGPPLDALHPHGRVPRRRSADHRARRRLLPRGRERQALPRRLGGPVLGQHRLLVRGGDRPGGARADARAALLHQLVVRTSARDRARRRGRVARARRPEPRLLRLGRLGGGRVGVEAGAAVLRGAGGEAAAGGRRRRARDQARRARGLLAHPAAPHEGDRPPRRLPRHDVRRALAERHPGDPDAVRAARARGASRAQHEPLPPAAGGDGSGVHALPARRPRADDPRDGSRDRLPRAHGAGAELRRLLHAADRLLAGRARDLRPLRHPALRRRGDHGLRPGRLLVRLRALRHPARHRHLLRRGSPPRTPRSAP